MASTPEPSVDIRLSDGAAKRIAAVAAGDPGVAGLRVAVEGGGCSGFQYDIAFAPGAEEGDIVIENGGARLFVDPVSVAFLAGSEIDWVQELIGSSFKVKNPNAKTSCGCGVSFSV